MCRQIIVTILSMLMLFGPCYVYAANEKPIETHNLLGKPVLMDYLTCVQKYGADFCKCTKLESGTTACYYQRPPSGYYTQEKCEQIWGAGQCEEEPTIAPPQNWKLKDGTREAGGSQCSGQVMIFPGKKEECRSKTGMIGLGGSCCFTSQGEECSFENIAETLGWDAGVVLAIKKATEYLAQQYVQPVMTEWMTDVLGGAGASMFASGNPVYEYLAENAFNEAVGQAGGVKLAQQALAGTSFYNSIPSDVLADAQAAYSNALATGANPEVAFNGALADAGYLDPSEVTTSDLGSNYTAMLDAQGVAPDTVFSNALSGAAISGVVSISFALLDGKLTSQELTDAAIDMAVAFAGAYIPGVGLAYMAYKMYNMLTAKTECLPFEYTLACKVGEGYCHYVGERCTSKIFGYCIGKKKVYCCFNSLLARVIHEQGRPQIGLDWGTTKSPKCRGFYPDEFAQLDFQKMDLSEFKDEIKRRSSINIEKSIESATERFLERQNP